MRKIREIYSRVNGSLFSFYDKDLKFLIEYQKNNQNKENEVDEKRLFY